MSLTPSQRQTLLVLAQAMIPAGVHVKPFGQESLDRLEQQLGVLPEVESNAFGVMLQIVEKAAIPVLGRSLSGASTEQAGKLLDFIFDNNAALRALLRMLAAPIKLAHFDNKEAFDAYGAGYRCASVKDEPAPWLASVYTPESWSEEELECDVVVVGSGAGGAVMAKELAERGLAVLIVESGPLHRREQFNGPIVNTLKDLFVNAGTNTTLGLPVVALPVGRSVGGSTTINSGTCLVPPESLFAEWRKDLGLPFTRDMLDPFYDRVSGVMQVEPAKQPWIGRVGDIIAQGCDALGFEHHGPLPRNAPSCDGQGTCCFGCPTDAKRSTNVSYIPMALRAGATLLSGFEVKHLHTRKGRATGLTAHGRTQDGHTRKVRVHARSVVVSGGTLFTPLLLDKNGMGRESGWLGRNLSIHPAVSAIAIMQDEVRGYNGIPQGYGVDEFKDEGIMLEGGFMPLQLMALTLSPYGPRYTSLMDRYNHMAIFAGMIKDTCRGRVVADPAGQPRAFYQLNQRDLKSLTKVLHHLVDIFHAAGAIEVYPQIGRWPRLQTARDIVRFKTYQPARLDFEVNAFHPLGTARLGADPKNSVVGPNHELHHVKHLYVADGSCVPSSLGVNPQMTIMALATRAAGLLADRLEDEDRFKLSGNQTQHGHNGSVGSKLAV